jgi:hypothetical protein
MTLRLLFAAIFLAVLSVPASAGDIGHIVYEGLTTFGPSGLAAIDKRIEVAAQDMNQTYPQGGARYVANDLAYPRDDDEYYKLGKYAVVLISAVTQDAAELPLARVAIRNGATLTDLKLLASGRRETAEGSVVREMYGRTRQDAFYLVPLDQVKRGATLECDFAANRQGFVIARLSEPPLGFIQADPGRKSGAEPSAAVLQAFIAREFPGILSTK